MPDRLRPAIQDGGGHRLRVATRDVLIGMAIALGDLVVIAQAGVSLAVLGRLAGRRSSSRSPTPAAAR